MQTSLSPGLPRPLGATQLPDGSWNFAVFSQQATSIELCLFDSKSPRKAEKRIKLPKQTGSVWHGAIRGLQPGQHYGFRIHGPWEPENALRCNPNKLQLDPYGRAISDTVQSHAAQCNPTDEMDETDSAPHVPKNVLVAPKFAWGKDTSPNIPWNETVVYETHIAGFTKLFDGVPTKIRGTYAGLAHDKPIRYLKELGVTTIQLMPVHHHMDDGFLLDRGLTNYWGYQTIGFFAPESRLASTDTNKGEHVAEFKNMVKKLHKAGLEVILDVVYNHTGEAGETGPAVSFRGIDDSSYYRHTHKNRASYRDFTGCGNTLDLRHPYVLKMILDSMRYWVTEMHVDGFRFDLAVTLGRESDGFNRESPFFQAIHQDPVLSKVKLIAEPWDLGPGGYQVGAFPEGWAELNGKYRDCMRRFWLGEPGLLPEFASRLTGSQDHYAASRRAPQASVNFLTSHDGFTIRDLSCYNEKHNEANGEENRDGDSHNHSFNHGHEGPTDDPAILKKREKHRRNLVSTLLLSLGTPFILAGDERGRSQGGNNNAYCQDNKISWMDWSKLSGDDANFLAYVKRLLAFRKSQPQLTRSDFFHGAEVDEFGIRDLVWYDFEGEEMGSEAWRKEAPGRIQAVIHDELLIIANAAHEPGKAKLPSDGWRHVIDTTTDEGFLPSPVVVSSSFFVPDASLQVFERG